MKRVVSSAVVLMVALLASQQAVANEVRPFKSSERLPNVMRVFGVAQAPYGHLRFCELYADQCTATSGRDERLHASPERLSELDEINRAVNSAIQPATDMEVYGVSEQWILPRDRGDCEDYALLKRHLLIRLGWPSSSLLVTVVRDEKSEGHAVLTARTVQGDYVLDNKVEMVKLWHKTPYQFVMRQSYLNPRVWVSLEQSNAEPPLAISGVQPGQQ